MSPGDSTVLGSFSAVDAAPDASTLVAALDEQGSVPAVQRLRATSIEMLGVKRGHHVVDVGCGTGDLARAIAGRVGSSGRVVGIDHSDVMLTEARRRSASTTLSVQFLAGDVTELTVDSDAFDASVCERVFQHVAQPERAMAELVRITRPGGRIVVIDTDWGLHAIHGADPRLTATITDAWARNAANGLVGRRLYALFADAGMQHPIVAADTMISTDPLHPLRPPFTAMAAVAVGAGAASTAEAERWLDDLASAGARGHFFWAVTMLAVAGTRPV